MNNKKRALTIVAVLIAAGALSGCGGTAYDLSSQPTTPFNTTNIPPSSGAVTPTPTPSASPTSTGVAALTFTGQITGSLGTTPTWTSPTINTDNTLTVKITPGPAAAISAGTPGLDSNFTGNYNCASFDILVLGDQVATDDIAIHTDQQCYTAAGVPFLPTESSQTIDFSGRLSPGHGPVSISVVGGRTDAYCQWLADNFYNMYSTAYLQQSWVPLFCEVKPIYKTHVATFNISVGIDGTNAP